MSEKTPHITAKELIRVLKKLGFIEEHTRGSHIIMYSKENKLRTVIPFHQGRTIPVGTLKSILADAEISVEKLRELL